MIVILIHLTSQWHHTQISHNSTGHRMPCLLHCLSFPQIPGTIVTDNDVCRLEQHIVDESPENPEEDIHRKKEQNGSQDGVVSIARLIAEQSIEAGALDPREYQVQLFERAKAQNTIAVLDTGSGKTLVAVLLLKYVLEQELLDRAEGAKPRVSFFLVDSVTLVFQQSSVLRSNLNQKVTHFYGALGPDLWDKATWKQHLENHMVFVCTADILNHALLNGHVKIHQINLLIFDEAHHAKKEHPYARYELGCFEK